MPPPHGKLRTTRTIVALIAAVALLIRGVLDRDQGGWALVLIAVALLGAVALRTFFYRD